MPEREPLTRQSTGHWKVLSALNLARAICFGDEPTTTSGAVRGESDRLDVACALTRVWDEHVQIVSDLTHQLTEARRELGRMAAAAHEEARRG